MNRFAAFLGIALLIGSPALAAKPATLPFFPTVTASRNGDLTYTSEPNGDRIPDFSYAGYMAGNSDIPTASAKVFVAPVPGDNTARIQAAIDYVSALPLDSHGLRGAVLLQKGTYEIDGGLFIRASGVVLRGQGMGTDGTVLLAAGLDRRTLITIAGAADRRVSSPIAVADRYVPVNASKFHVETDSLLKPGGTILIRRPCTAAWIAALNAHDLGGGMGSGWRPNSRELIWDRTVTSVDGNTITLDAPITNSLDVQFGGGGVSAYTWPGRIENVGFESLRCDSSFDPANPKDEAHSWIAITMECARDCWVRQIVFTHFAGSAVTLLDSTSRITVEDCKSLDPISENAGYRRNTFVTDGQQNLFQRCYSENGRHDFAIGFCAAGPNAFVQCEAKDAQADSGPIDSWAAGVLLDNIRLDGAALGFYDRENANNFAGWSGANSVLWQCNASQINCFDPPTARNWCYASWGMFAGDSHFVASDNNLPPDSLYYGQLAARLGPSVMHRAQLLFSNPRSSRNPTVADAAEAIAHSVNPAPQLSDWIDKAPTRNPIPTDAAGALTLESLGLPKPDQSPPPAKHHMAMTNGWIVDDGAIAVGGVQGIKWWRGGIRPDEVAESLADGPNPVRFVPGRIGRGLTDDLNQLAGDMYAAGRIALDYHYALWYDIRDIDHERVRRIDGDVWPPFYDLPFARSGTGIAWDGLSKYDLTKYNPWYFSRLKQLADIFELHGQILFNQNFFQHNILEAGAHWASCPWRSANNINDTGFPEPPPYAGDKLIYMAKQFYDVTNSTRTAIYAAYIRHCLDNFADNSNVIQFTSAEYSGPLAFTQFWLDTVAQWEKETGKKPIIALSAPKDVQDAILADPDRAKIVDVIDIRYWWYQPSGKLYDPPGGQNLTPRQWLRETNPKFPNFDSAYRAVHEYRQKFPDKAILIGPEDGGISTPWAVLMAGGSLPNLPGLDANLRAAIAGMKPVDAPAGELALGDSAGSFLVYGDSAGSPRPGSANLHAHYVDPRTGRLVSGTTNIVWLSGS